MAFTFFMRDQPTLEHAAEHMIRYASGRSRIKIWAAGCAHGQETWTIAMNVAERMKQFGFKNLACQEILKIYSGHDEPITGDCREMIRQTMHNVSRIDRLSGDRGG